MLTFCYSLLIGLATRAAFRFSRVLFFLFSTKGAIGTECIMLRTNGSVKPSWRLNFNLHGEGFYCCCWFSGAKCLTSSGIFPIASRLIRSRTKQGPKQNFFGAATKRFAKEWDKGRVQIVRFQGSETRKRLSSQWMAARWLFQCAVHQCHHRQRVMVHFEYQQPCFLMANRF